MGDSDPLEPFPVEQQLRRDGWSVSLILRFCGSLLNMCQPCRATSFDAHNGICCEHPSRIILCASSESAHGMLAPSHSNKRGRGRTPHEWSRYATFPHASFKAVDVMNMCLDYTMWALSEIFTHMDLARLCDLNVDKRLPAFSIEPWDKLAQPPGELSRSACLPHVLMESG